MKKSFLIFSGVLIIATFFCSSKYRNSYALDWGETDDKKQLQNLITPPKKELIKPILKKSSANEIYKRYADAIVLIRLYNESGEPVALGSGFNLLKTGLTVTNLHLFSGASHFDVKFPKDGVYEDCLIAAMSNKSEDVVLVKITGREFPAIDAEITSDVEVGNKVFVIGNPEGLVNSLSEGIISGVREFSSGHKYYQITAPISPGSSGSAVFDEYGRLLGIATFGSVEGQNLNFCIPITEIANIDFFSKPMTLKQFSKTKGEEIAKYEESESETNLISDEELRVNIVFDYLKLNEKMSGFWMEENLDKWEREGNKEMIAGHLVYLSENVEKFNDELQKKYSLYKGKKINQEKRVGDLLSSIDYLTSCFVYSTQMLATEQNELAYAKFKLMDDTVFSIVNPLLLLITIDPERVNPELTISDVHKMSLLKYIKSTFDDDIRRYSKKNNKPSYIYGILAVQGALEGKSLKQSFGVTE